MGSCHTPMVTFARRFDRFCERTADHHGVCTAGESFADVPTLAHSSIGDDWNIVAGLFIVVIARGGTIYRRRYLWNTQAQDTS